MDEGGQGRAAGDGATARKAVRAAGAAAGPGATPGEPGHADAAGRSAGAGPDGAAAVSGGRLEALMGAVAEAASVEAAVRAIRDGLPARHVSYIAARRGQEPHRDPYVRTTYPAAWIARYLFMEYWKVDPVLIEGFRRSRPFDWSALEGADPARAAFFADARAHGVGANGLLVPLVNRHGRRAILSVSTEREGEAFAAWRAAVLEPLLALGSVVHARAVHEVFGDAPPPPRLSPREREVLAWIGEGKEVPDIAIITGLSEHTVRTYLKSARLKLECGTRAQAVVKAERLALLASEDE